MLAASASVRQRLQCAFEAETSVDLADEKELSLVHGVNSRISLTAVSWQPVIVKRAPGAVEPSGSWAIFAQTRRLARARAAHLDDATERRLMRYGEQELNSFY
jgi:hypothetical protein